MLPDCIQRLFQMRKCQLEMRVNCNVCLFDLFSEARKHKVNVFSISQCICIFKFENDLNKLN